MEAQELLKAMKMARLYVSSEVDETSPSESIRQAIESISARNGSFRWRRYTACVRTARPHERNLKYPTVKVSLALREGHLMISPEGTLLSVERVSPMVSNTALRKLGYRIICDELVFEVVHKENGPLEIDTSTGCPEVPRKVAEDLIEKYEALVRHRKVAQARIAAISHDLGVY